MNVFDPFKSHDSPSFTAVVLAPPASEPAVEVDVLPEPAVEVDVLPEPAVVPAAPDLEPEPGVEAAPALPADPAETEATPAPEEGPKPAPFTRPAAQSAPRKPKARPIYIHSQLDEEGFEPPRAVNHP